MTNRLYSILSIVSKTIVLLTIFIFAPSSNAQEVEEAKVNYDFTNKVIVDYSLYFEQPRYRGQHQHYPSIAFEPELDIDWNDGKQNIVIDLFGRLDWHDDRRSHFDIREFYYQYISDKWEVSVGLKKIYWGVTEINHLVDIINQTDVVESFDGEQKLGQPLLQFTYLTNWGTLDFFALPYHRQRVFPGREGRLRPIFTLDNDETEYESRSEEYKFGGAFRYSHSIGIADIGLSHFYGTSREPLIGPSLDQIFPYYPIIHQTGLDLQLTTGSALWKLEVIRRDGEGEHDVLDFYAFDAGIEYTFGNINNKGLDIGVLAEYLYDERDEFAPTGLDNDIFIGCRFAYNDINDTQFLFGGAFDLEQSGKLFSIEASRRFFQNYTLEFEGRFILGIDKEEISYPIRDDSFLKLTVERFF